MRSSVSLISHFFTLSIIFPVIVGSLNFKRLDRGLKFVCYYLVFAMLYEKFQPYLHSAFYINIIQYIFTICFTFFYSTAFLEWAGIEKAGKIILIEILLICCFMLIEINFIGLNTFRISLLSLSINLLFTLFLIYLINKTLNNNVSSKNKQVKLLILIPNLIFYCYYNILDILMLFLYSPQTKQLFINLNWVAKFLLIGLYTCFSLAFYLKPKKEIYLQ